MAGIFPALHLLRRRFLAGVAAATLLPAPALAFLAAADTGDKPEFGRRASNGCIGLYNDQIAELFNLAVVGTQVKLI